MKLDRPWHEYTFIAFDTETSGAYPVGLEVVEFGAVKWRAGQVIDRYSSLFSPSKPMTDEIIKIHGIDNEMVKGAPQLKDKIGEIREFFDDAILMAHHAPFDMGFMAYEFEKYHQVFPTNPVLCTSLLSRKVILDSQNHKLQTLIKHLNIEQGTAHRALDDSAACLQVGLECMKRIGSETSLTDVFKLQKKELLWGHYALLTSADAIIRMAVDAVLRGKDMDIVYAGGTHKGKTRRITPLGIVRNPDGDFIPAICHIDKSEKRFYLNKITDAAQTSL